MNIGTYKITAEWVKLSELFGKALSTDYIYVFENKGSETMLVANDLVEPSPIHGFTIAPQEKFSFNIETGDLWVRALATATEFYVENVAKN